LKTIYFVRHGESEANISNVMSGIDEEVHLTLSGVKQAKRAGHDLKDKNIQLIVSSPLHRTVETATYIAKEIGYNPEKIITNPLLIERSYGIYEGGSNKVYYNDLAKNTVHESVEAEKDVYSRIKEALEWLKSLKEEHIMLVSHRGVGRAVRVINENLHHSHMYKIEGFANTEIYQFNL
jgi:broad specificity phosphatase PhoE